VDGKSNGSGPTYEFKMDDKEIPIWRFLAAGKPEVVIFSVVYELEVKFQKVFELLHGWSVQQKWSDAWIQNGRQQKSNMAVLAAGKPEIVKFRMSVNVLSCRSLFHCIGDPKNYGICIWNQCSIYNTTVFITTSGFGTFIPFPGVGQHPTLSATLPLCWRSLKMWYWHLKPLIYL